MKLNRGKYEYEIKSILDGFGVRLHYRESGPNGHRRYAVWSKMGQASQMVSEPTTHAKATEDCRSLQANAIIDFIERELANG